MSHEKGNVPRDADALIYTPSDPMDTENPMHGWALYRRSVSAAPWVSLKLIRVKRAKGSANYWLGWHSGDQRLSRTRDGLRLRTQHPAIYQRIERVMRTLYPTLTAADMGMPTEGKNIFD